MFCFCFYRTFVPIFYFNSVVLLTGGSRIFLAQGAKYPSYATAGTQWRRNPTCNTCNGGGGGRLGGSRPASWRLRF